MATRRNDHEYTKRRDALKRRATLNQEPCALCLKPIDYTLHYLDAMAFTADHIESIKSGGRMLGPLQPAHRSCNSRKGAGANKAPQGVEISPVRPTTVW